MISVFVREQKRYTQQELRSIMECSEEEIVLYIRKLKEYGVLKSVKASDLQKNMSDLLEEDVEIEDVEAGGIDYFYVFTYVGIIVTAGRVLKCCPKYLLHVAKPVTELRQIIKVLEKYNSKEQIVRMFSDENDGGIFNLLAVLLFLLQDYYENGIYNNTEDIIESNGSGEILWDKTICESFAFFSGNRPYYIDLQTKKRVDDEYDFFRRLHECVLTKASRELREADLLDIFETTDIELTEEELDDFGDKEYILYRIRKELNVQFNTRKQLVLKTIYSYIEHNGNLYDADCLSMFGTNKFNLVWEDVCADILDNRLETKLELLDLPMPLSPQYDKTQKLIEIIEKPLWTVTGKTASKTLRPDLVAITGCGKEYGFVIFDAKYYNARLESNMIPKGQPGIESITKQYLYQLAYQQFIKDHGFSWVKNCFLLPTETDSITDKGEVSMNMLRNLGLQNIKVRLLPATLAYKYYLLGRKLDIHLLNL